MMSSLKERPVLARPPVRAQEPPGRSRRRDRRPEPGRSTSGQASGRAGARASPGPSGSSAPSTAPSDSMTAAEAQYLARSGPIRATTARWAAWHRCASLRGDGKRRSSCTARPSPSSRCPSTPSRSETVHGLGRAAEAARQYAIWWSTSVSSMRSTSVIYNRELAYFHADHEMKLDAALAAGPRPSYEVQTGHLRSRRPRMGALQVGQRRQEALAPMDGGAQARHPGRAALLSRRDDPRVARQPGPAPGTTWPGRWRRIRHFHVLHAAVAERTLDELAAGHLAETDAR